MPSVSHLGLMSLAAALVAAHAPARAEAPRGLACPDLVVDLGLVVASPTVSWPGQSLGVGLGVQVGLGPFLVGGRASFSEAAEDDDTARVTADELRLRAVGGVRAGAGRGTWFLRLGLGATAVREGRAPHREIGGAASARWAGAFAVDLEGGLDLALAGAWGVVFAGGPTLATGDGGLGWVASVSLAWRP